MQYWDARYKHHLPKQQVTGQGKEVGKKGSTGKGCTGKVDRGQTLIERAAKDVSGATFGSRMIPIV